MSDIILCSQPDCRQIAQYWRWDKSGEYSEYSCSEHAVQDCGGAWEAFKAYLAVTEFEHRLALVIRLKSTKRQIDECRTNL